MRQFYLSRNSYGYYRVHFVDPITGVQGVGKSTHTKDKVEATMIATSWLQNGVPAARSNSRSFSGTSLSVSSPLNLNNIVERLTQNEAQTLMNMISAKFGFSTLPNIAVQQNILQTENVMVVQEVKKPGIKLVDYLLNFWDYENSEFIKRYLAHGHNMTKKHTQNMLSLVRNYWKPYFGEDTCVEDLDKATLDDFFFYLNLEKGLKGGTVNKAINCGSRAMNYLFENGKIKINPMAGVERFNAQELERGIPTESEVKALLNLNWKDEVYKLAFKLGVFCGLRAGEISGLRVCDLDLDADFIHIRHSWSEIDGLKCPKNSDVRDLPIDHTTLLQLYNQAKNNPQFSDISYVFFSPVKPEQPYWPSNYIDGLYDALAEIGISEEQRKERNIVFHSLRHFCATVLNQRTDLKTVQAIMGHRTEEMSKHYSDHETQEKLQNMKNIMQVTWNEILSA